MLLVDDDQAEVAQRREDGRAGADADARLAAAQAPPFVVALAVGEGRVQDGEAVAEPRPEARHRLRRQADLGDEDDRPLAARQRRLDRGQVDLGLARAGDAVQEQLARGAGLAVERGDDPSRPRRSCSGSSSRPAAAGADLGVARAAPHPRAAGRDQAALLEPPQDAAVGADRGRQLRRRHLARPQRLQHGPLLDPEPLAAAQRLLPGRRRSRPAAPAASAPAARRRRSPAAAPAAARATGSSSTRGRSRGRAGPAQAACRPRALRSARRAAPAAAPRPPPARRRRRARAACRRAPWTTLPTSRSAIAAGRR